MDETLGFSERFSEYFKRDVAEKAAHSLTNGAEIEFRIVSRIDSTEPPAEVFSLTRKNGKNLIQPQAAVEPQLLFTMTPQAAEAVLADSAQEIGEIGVNIAKLIVGGDSSRKISIKFRAGFLSLYSKGYLGIFTAGGTSFAGYLASRGLSGIGTIKAVLKKAKSD